MELDNTSLPKLPEDTNIDTPQLREFCSIYGARKVLTPIAESGPAPRQRAAEPIATIIINVTAGTVILPLTYNLDTEQACFTAIACKQIKTAQAGPGHDGKRQVSKEGNIGELYSPLVPMDENDSVANSREKATQHQNRASWMGMAFNCNRPQSSNP